MDKKQLSDWIYKNCKWVQSLSTYNESFIEINIPINNADLDTNHGKKYHDKDTKHYHWYFPRLGSWKHAEKRIFNDLQKGVIKIEERA